MEPTFANLEFKKGAETHGCLYALSVGDFETLWTGEGALHISLFLQIVNVTTPVGIISGSGKWYNTELVTVQTYEGETVEGCTIFCCVAAKRLPKSYPPSLRYMSLLRDGARELGLSREYQKMLNTLPVAEVPSGYQKLLVKGFFYFHQWVSKSHTILPRILATRIQQLDTAYGACIHSVAKRTLGTQADFIVPLLMIPFALCALVVQIVYTVAALFRKY